MDKIERGVYVVIIFLCLFFGCTMYICEYFQVTKHYKDMGFFEYVMIRDKLVITPDRGE
jgi:hypothetical protein